MALALNEKTASRAGTQNPFRCNGRLCGIGKHRYTTVRYNGNTISTVASRAVKSKKSRVDSDDKNNNNNNNNNNSNNNKNNVVCSIYCYDPRHCFITYFVACRVSTEYNNS